MLLRTGLRVATQVDNTLDVSGAYPNGEIIMNISKETTLRELCAVAGVSEKKLRRTCLNQTAARINAVEICQDILHAPELEDLLEEFMQVELGAV